jgi:hypothetical protein
MYRKVIAALLTTRQSSEAVNSFQLKDSAATLLQTTSRFCYNRKSPLNFWFSPLICLFSAITLFAAPDPDLFDGRVTTLSSDSELTAGSSESIGNEFRDNGNEGGSAGVGGIEGVGQRDLESVGNTGGGETVESFSSKDASSSGGTERAVSDSRKTTTVRGAHSEPTSKVEASSVGIGSSGTPTTEASGEPSGGSGFASQEPRNFEDFGFGGADMPETIEVNRSKESTTPTGLLSGESTTPPKFNDFTTAAGQEATGGSQAGNGSLGVDYGTKLPSGL